MILSPNCRARSRSGSAHGAAAAEADRLGGTGEEQVERFVAAAHLVASFKPAIEEPWDELHGLAHRWLAHPLRLQPDLLQVLQSNAAADAAARPEE